MKITLATAVMLSLLVTGMNVLSFANGIKDEQIEKNIKKTYVFKNYLKADNVAVESKDGVVTLTGTVTEDSHKSLAENTAESIDGVRSVDDKLTVQGAGQQEGSDSWILVKVKTALLFHKYVSATKTDIDVKDGVVTLKGMAQSQSQKDLTSEYARDIKGVKDVKNEMTVVKGKNNAETMKEKIDDASITAQIKADLLFKNSTSAVNTKVTTKNGVVTLAGTAIDETQKVLTGKIAENVKGVSKVINNMSIAPK